MTDKSENPSTTTSSAQLELILDQLACPACLGNLRLDEQGLICAGCGRTYPIVDGIPALIAEQTEQTPAGSTVR